MGFLIVYLLIGTLCSLWSGFSLTAHSGYPTWLICCVYAALMGSWFSPILIWHWQHKNISFSRLYNAAAYCSYCLFGFVFLLFAVLLLRDLFWYGAYVLGLSLPSPFAVSSARAVNTITVVAVALCCIYAMFAATKLPQVLHHTYRDERIKRPLRMLVVSDWHINRTISPQKVAERVVFINSLKPDVILMPGDIADDEAEAVRHQFKELKKLRAPEGIFYTVGNHEIYHNPFVWEATFAALGWQVLHNSGAAVEDSGVYVGGVPDSQCFASNVAQAVKNADNEAFRIVLSHQPKIALSIPSGAVDLVISGHTHGGQMIPFNFLTKFGNGGFVAGEYKLPHTTLLLSRGIGYWGPPMRIGAPNDVILINLEPQC